MERRFRSMKVDTVKHQGALDYALDVVSALGEAGLTAVPIKPSTEMLTAGARAGDVGVETAWRIYQAMVQAAE